jgi:hypothetical protein
MVAGLQSRLTSVERRCTLPKRLGRPDEYAALARHIVENVMFNGETIRLDGGLPVALGQWRNGL